MSNINVVWKYALAPTICLEMPVGAQIISVGEQNDEVCMWALVNPAAVTEGRNFVSVPTGSPVPDLELRFIGTAFLHDGKLVLHVFEHIPSEPLY